MKTSRLYILLCLFATAFSWAQSSDCGMQTVIISEDKAIDWSYPEVLVLQDSFSGPQLDRNIWGFGFPWGRFLIEESLEGMAEENLSFEDGHLVIKTERRPRNFDRFIFENGELVGTEPVLKEFSSAGIFSYIEFTRGCFELDYRMDAISAQWPAFWLLGDCQQEIDIFEYFYGQSAFHDNWTKEITYTLHQDYYCGDDAKCRLIKKRFRDDDFHNGPLYSALDWDQHQLRFYRKANEPEWIHYRWRDFSYRPIAYPQQGDILYQSSYFPFDKPMRLLIGQGVHPGLQEKLNSGPKYLRLNQVKVWQKAEPSGKHKLNQAYPYSSDYDGIITGEIVSLEDPSPFEHKNYLIVRALKETELLPGFDSGDHFVDIKAPNASEIRYPKTSQESELTPQNIIAISFYDFQGNERLKLEFPERALHLRDDLIQSARLEHQLEGLFIVLIHLSDGSRRSIKLGFF